MSSLVSALRRASQLLPTLSVWWKPQAQSAAMHACTTPYNSLLTRLTSVNIVKRFKHQYDPYPDIETSSPYKKPRKYRYGYKYKYFNGGVLPRPKGHFEDEPVPMPRYNPKKANAWTEEKALFGQNDYIDILGDGSIHPYQLMKGPMWLRGFRGNEMQRLIRQLKFEGTRLQTEEPTKYHNIKKRIFFLYKAMNKRHRAPFWGNKVWSRKSRIDRVHDDH